MKIGSQQTHGPARVMHKKAGICMMLSIIVLFISTKTIVKVPSFFKGYVIGGIQKSLSAIGSFFTGTVGAVSELRKIEKDYEALLEKTQDYELKVRDYTALREENQRLKELLGLSTLPDAKKIAAHVIARDPTNMYSSLVIDKGYINGIRKYMPVVAYQNGIEGLVGKVIEVKASTSILQPFYDQRFFAAARLAKTRAEGMLNGQGFRDVPLNLLYIPKSEMEQLKQGDIVVTSGLDEIFPPEIIIGRVEGWRLNEFSSSLVISVQPAVDLSRIEYVFAIDIQAPSHPGKEAIQ